jgi:hypothetical protein
MPQEELITRKRHNKTSSKKLEDYRKFMSHELRELHKEYPENLQSKNMKIAAKKWDRLKKGLY